MMRSSKAQEYIDKHTLVYSYDGDFYSTDAEKAVEIAEEEMLDMLKEQVQTIASLKENLYCLKCPILSSLIKSSDK